MQLLSRANADVSSDPAFRGWNLVALHLPQGPEATLAVYRPSVISAWSCCLALVGAAFVLRLRRLVHGIGPIAGLLAAVAIASEPPLAWLAAGASLGLLAGGGFLLLQQRPDGAVAEAGGNSGSSTILLPSGHAAGVAVFLLALAAARCLLAAPPDSRRAAESARARVVIPIDEHQQPSGDYVYLEPAFYDELHRLTDMRPADLPQWLLDSARYEVPAAPASRGDSAAIDELHATFDFHTFQPGIAVSLPLRRDQAMLLEARARLDGRIVALAWQVDGAALSVPVDAPGKHRLELALGAVARRSGDTIVLDMAIPPAAISTVVLPSGGPASGELISPAAGPIVIEGSRRFHLANETRLAVRWPAADVAANLAALEGEQLLWWKVRPGSVVLEGRFRLRGTGGPIRDAVIEVDPRLRLLPSQSSGPIARVRVEEGTTNLVKVELAEPGTADTPFRLAWLWPDASGVGKLLLPAAHLKGERLARDWTAVSVEPGLEIGRLPDASGAPSAAEFVQAWGEANVVPVATFGASTDRQHRAVVVRPITTLPQAQQAIDWSISSSVGQATCSLQLTDVPSTRFEHSLTLPPQLKVSRVTLAQTGRLAVTRWTQQADGRLVVTLLEPPATEQTLTVAAEIALAKNRPEFRLAAISIADAKLNESRLHIYRQGDVQLELSARGGLAGWTRDDHATLGEYRSGLGRLVAALVSPGATAIVQPTLSRSPNQPHLAGKMFIRAAQSDGDWRCEVDLDLQIAGGVLDELHLSIPEEWSRPIEIEPTMEQRVEASVGEARRRLTLRPREAVSGRLQVRLRGSLHSGGAGVQAPDVAVLGGSAIERLVVLDRGSPSERIDWDTTGLLAAGATAAATVPAPWRDTGDVYRVIGHQFEATARMRQASAAAPRVSLVDVSATARPGRRLAMVATLTIHPSGARDATFQLPPGCRLVQALVDGAAMPCTASGPRLWKCPAPSDVLPYRLTIVYDTFLPADSAGNNSLHLSAPRLIGMDVQQSLWSIRLEGSEVEARVRDADPTPSALGRSAKSCSQQQAELARLEASLQALEDIVAAQGSNVPTSVLAESFIRWQRAVDLNRGRLVTLTDQAETPGDVTERMQAATEAAAKVAQRLMQAGIIPDSHVAPSISIAAEEEASRVRHVLVTGPADELQLSWPRSTGRSWSFRPIIAWCLAIAAVMLWPLSRSLAARNWLVSHARFVLAMAGFAWWLLAPLGWLGWLLVLAAAWLTVRSPWPRAAYDAGSTFHRYSANPSR